MRGSTWTVWTALGLCGALAWSHAAWAGVRSAKEILAEIDAVRIPTLDRAARKDKNAVAEFVPKLQAAQVSRGVLVRELWRTDPDNNRLTALLGETWWNEIQRAIETRNEALKK